MLAVLLALMLCCPLDATLPPPASDAQRFSQVAVKAALDAADAHEKWLSENGHLRLVKVMRFQWVEDVWVESPQLAEQWWREQCWRALHQAKTGTNPVQSLEYLRSLIGPGAYAAGIMPSPLPQLGRGGR